MIFIMACLKKKFTCFYLFDYAKLNEWLTKLTNEMFFISSLCNKFAYLHKKHINTRKFQGFFFSIIQMCNVLPFFQMINECIKMKL
jgi:hypothetical protein